MRLIEGIINKGFERKYKIDDTCDDCIEESMGSELSDYQKWVDYDMEKYHHISKKTMEEIKKAGLSVVKDQYGDYEVIADRKIEEADTSNSVDSIVKFVNRAIDGLKNGKATNYRYKLDDRLAIFVGWTDGYDENDDSVIHNADDPSMVIAVGVKVWTSDDMWTDFDYLNFPYYEDGTVVDNYSEAISPDEDIKSLVEYLLKGYEELKDLEIDEDGLILGDTANMDESCGKSLKESPVYDMRPQFSGRKSFYGKARVDDSGDTKTLYSYDTPVARIKDGKATLLPGWKSSQTTLRHVKEFLKQNSFWADNMRQIEKDYPMEEGCAVKECNQGLKEARGGVRDVQIEKIRLSNGTAVQGYGYTTSTRTYVYEHVELDVGYKHGEGVYKWMNRPWQRFTYEKALRDAAREIGLFDVATEIAERTSNLEQFIGELAKYLEENGKGNEEPINEAIEDIDIADLANWLKETSESMAKGDMQDATISRYGGKSFAPYTICMYWVDGADPDDDALIHSEESPEYVLAVGIKIDNPNEWDGAFLDFPEINGELFDTEMLMVSDEDFEALAQEIASNYHTIVSADEE